MSPAERIYDLLLRLFPAKHRQDYADAMLLHARDLNRDANQVGRWKVARLCISLIKDGLWNAWMEHWEVSMANNRGIVPASWLVVLLAALPGLLILVTRRLPGQLKLLPQETWYLYLALLVIGVPIIWWRIKSFPLWALLPFGALAWSLVFVAGMGLSDLGNSLGILTRNPAGMQWGIALMNIAVIALIMPVMLRGKHLKRMAWILGGIILAGNIVIALFYSLYESRTGAIFSGLTYYFTTAGIGPLEGLMLVALGMLFAREHGVLAILVLIGGYSYMFADSDYLFGHPQRDWAWLTTYFAAITILFLVVVPVALLRAKTRLGRALAIFVPVFSFHVLRFTVPLLVIPEPVRISQGELVWVLNILLMFVLAWVVYSQLGDEGRISVTESQSNLESAMG